MTHKKEMEKSVMEKERYPDAAQMSEGLRREARRKKVKGYKMAGLPTFLWVYLFLSSS